MTNTREEVADTMREKAARSIANARYVDEGTVEWNMCRQQFEDGYKAAQAEARELVGVMLTALESCGGLYEQEYDEDLVSAALTKAQAFMEDVCKN